MSTASKQNDAKIDMKLRKKDKIGNIQKGTDTFSEANEYALLIPIHLKSDLGFFCFV